MRHPFLSTYILLLYLPLVSATAASSYEDPQIRLHLSAHTPQQMAAFYEARGFPKAMIDKLSQACFLTVVIKNKTNTILWHDLTKWTFTSSGKVVQRYDRTYWKSLWQRMNIPMASQSTFRWTLMPEQLDFRPQESEGGNITLPRGPLTYDIVASFPSGADKTGPVIKASLTAIRCAEDTP